MHAEAYMVHAYGTPQHSHAMLQPPVAQSAPLYPAAHVHVHDPVVPPGVPCVESQTIVPAVLPSPAVHALAANPKPSHCIIHGKHVPVECAAIDEAHIMAAWHAA